MPRESGASSNHRVMGCAPIEAVATGSPAFAGDDKDFEALLPQKFTVALNIGP
jgi:hypothetical protein